MPRGMTPARLRHDPVTSARSRRGRGPPSEGLAPNGLGPDDRPRHSRVPRSRALQTREEPGRLSSKAPPDRGEGECRERPGDRTVPRSPDARNLRRSKEVEALSPLPGSASLVVHRLALVVSSRLVLDERAVLDLEPAGTGDAHSGGDLAELLRAVTRRFSRAEAPTHVRNGHLGGVNLPRGFQTPSGAGDGGTAARSRPFRRHAVDECLPADVDPAGQQQNQQHDEEHPEPNRHRYLLTMVAGATSPPGQGSTPSRGFRIPVSRRAEKAVLQPTAVCRSLVRGMITVQCCGFELSSRARTPRRIGVRSSSPGTRRPGTSNGFRRPGAGSGTSGATAGSSQRSSRAAAGRTPCSRER